MIKVCWMPNRGYPEISAVAQHATSIRFCLLFASVSVHICQKTKKTDARQLLAPLSGCNLYQGAGSKLRKRKQTAILTPHWLRGCECNTKAKRRECNISCSCWRNKPNVLGHASCTTWIERKRREMQRSSRTSHHKIMSCRLHTLAIQQAFGGLTGTGSGSTHIRIPHTYLGLDWSGPGRQKTAVKINIISSRPITCPKNFPLECLCHFPSFYILAMEWRVAGGFRGEIKDSLSP